MELLVDALMEFLVFELAFLLTIVFGFWLSKLGKPYHGALFTIHKLLALGAVVAVGVQLFRTLERTDTHAVLIILLALAMVCVIALFASGALMSQDKLDYNLLRTIHRLAPIVFIVVIFWAIYLVV
jgi:hypothetical protein